MTKTVDTSATACYEEYPYPAHGVISSVIPLMLRETVDGLTRATGTTNLSFLDAGCGTGEQTLGMARSYPGFRVVGVDRNPASLKMARELAAGNSLNADFRERDLLGQWQDTDQFDLISCVGVLHYFADPRPALRNLLRHARPHGVLLGMVYGEFGKWELFRIRDALRLICGPDMPRSDVLDVLRQNRLASNSGLRHYAQVLRKRWRFGPRILAWEAVRRVVGGRSDTYQADTYTIANEHAYTWAGLADVLDESGWRLVGWPTKSGMPDQPEQLFKGKALAAVKQRSLLEQAAIYERIVTPLNLYFLATPKQT